MTDVEAPIRYVLLATVCALVPFGLDGNGRIARAQDLREVFQKIGGFTEREWAGVQRGEAIAKILDTDAREIAVAGAVRIDAPRELLIARYRDVENLKRSALVLQVGTFTGVPNEEHLRALAFEEYDLDLRACRAGDCRVRMATEDIARFHREIDWNASDWRERSAALWRKVLSGYAAAYSRNGIGGLPVYANRPEPLSVSGELRLLLNNFDIATSSPDFHAYLQQLGPHLPPGAESVLYWTKEDFGIRPVTRITHQTICRCGVSGAVLIAANQIYANHYLDAALGLTMAIDVPGAAKPSFYLIAINRARTRSLSGILRALVRSTVRDRSRNAMEKILRTAKTRLEGG